MSLSSALHLWCSYSVRAQTDSDRSKHKPEETWPVPTMCGPLDWTLPWMQVNGTSKISCGNMWNCSWNTWLVKDQRRTTGYTEGKFLLTENVSVIFLIEMCNAGTCIHGLWKWQIQSNSLQNSLCYIWYFLSGHWNPSILGAFLFFVLQCSLISGGVLIPML